MGLPTSVIALLLAGVAASGIMFAASGTSPAEAASAIRSSGDMSGSSLFGRQVLALDAGLLDRWQVVLSRHRAQQDSAEWRSLVSDLRNDSDGALLERVNRAVNRVRPVLDPRDEWKTPVDFLRGGGDCEDYAIAKLMLLRELGVPASSMRILALYARPGIPAHAVLVVDAEQGPTVLDNMRPRTYLVSRSITSRAAYAINETGWWISVGDRSLLAAQ